MNIHVPGHLSALPSHILRSVLASQIDELIELMDALDADPDLEDGADGEPWLGWPEHMSGIGNPGVAQDGGDDREDENEHGGYINDEPHDPEGCEL